MYLSRLFLNPRNRAVQRDLADCQEMHRTIMVAFPPVAGVFGPRADLGVLYRVELASNGGRVALLVQSRAQPDWAHLAPGYLDDRFPSGENPACKQVDQIYERMATGVSLRFRLLANPSKKVDTRSGPDGERRNGRRVKLHDEQGQIEWLRRKGEQHGFTLLRAGACAEAPSIMPRPVEMVTGRRIDDAKSDRRRLTFGAVLFDGELRVTDAAKFRAALESGIGPGKAYGLGMLSLAPLRS